ncbi:hypothetical protein [Streptomyces sp. JNUCC 63]
MAQHLDLSDETPSNRADVFALRESAGLTFSWQLGPAKVEVTTDKAESTSPSAIGVTMLLLAAGGSVPAVLFTLAGRAAHVPPALIAVGAIVLFLVVFGTGTLLILRGGAGSSPPANPAPSSEEVPPGRRSATQHTRNRRTRPGPAARARRNR